MAVASHTSVSQVLRERPKSAHRRAIWLDRPAPNRPTINSGDDRSPQGVRQAEVFLARAPPSMIIDFSGRPHDLTSFAILPSEYHEALSDSPPSRFSLFRSA